MRLSSAHEDRNHGYERRNSVGIIDYFTGMSERNRTDIIGHCCESERA